MPDGVNEPPTPEAPPAAPPSEWPTPGAPAAPPPAPPPQPPPEPPPPPPAGPPADEQEGTSLRRILLVGVVTAIIPALIAVLGVVWSSREGFRQERDAAETALENERKLTAPDIDVAYYLLRSPDRLARNGDGPGDTYSDDLTTAFGDFRVLAGGRSVGGVEIDADAIDDRSPEDCYSDACRATLADPGLIEAQTVYLVVRNEGARSARDLTITFEPIVPVTTEQEEFVSVFTAEPDGERFSEALGTLGPDESILVPLAALLVVDPTNPPVGTMVFGDVRRPVSISFDDGVGPEPVEVDVRRPLDGVVFQPASEPFEGGG